MINSYRILVWNSETPELWNFEALKYFKCNILHNYEL
jgi:hypothetical protein